MRDACVNMLGTQHEIVRSHQSDTLQGTNKNPRKGMRRLGIYRSAIERTQSQLVVSYADPYKIIAKIIVWTGMKVNIR